MKAKDIVFLLLFVFSILMGTYLLVFKNPQAKREVVLLEPADGDLPQKPQNISDPLVLSYGWSILPDVAKATDSALAMMQKDVSSSRPVQDVSSPKFILTFYTEPYDAAIIRDRIRSAFPNAKLLGLQSDHAVFSTAGLHYSENGAVVVLGFYADDFLAGVAGGYAAEYDDHRKNAHTVIDLARADAGKTAEDQPDGIIAGPVFGYSEFYIETLNQELAKNIPMIGGNQLTSEVTMGSLIVNDQVYSSGFALALLYTHKKIGANFHGGFSGRIKYGIVTEVNPSDNHIIVQIDDRPALEVYNEWADNKFSQYLNLKEPLIINEIVLNPLSKPVQLESGELHHLTLSPWKFYPDRSINVGVAAAVGDRVYYVQGDQEVLIQRCAAVARNAMIQGDISYRTVAGGVHIYCAGAGKHLGIGEQGSAARIVDEINLEMKGKPFIGGFLGGEQGTVQGYGFFAGTLMSTMMVFSEESK